MLFRTFAFLGIVAMAACTGQIAGASPEGTDEPGAAPQDRPGASPAMPASPSSPAAPSAPGAAACQPSRDPGTVLVRRLTHAEYDNTIRDLLGDGSQPGRGFPSEGAASTGFDNEAVALSASPLLIDAYATTARTLVDNLMNGPNRKLVVACDLAAQGAACAETTITAFARRAFRRPITASERQRLVAVMTGATGLGESVESALKLALRAVLISPKFLYRIEADPAPGSQTAHAVGPYELASRLSYFLWSTMPDDPLFAAADSGRLGTADGVAEQVTRMLRDKKADGFVRNFAGQWLQLRTLPAATRDPKKYPRFDDALKTSMQTETESFVKSFLTETKDVRELLTAKYAYADARLAQLYGLAGAPMTGFARLDAAGAPRAGLLTQASVLTVTSNTAGTLPPRRGKWVLGQLLCREPPPPPPDVPALAQEAKPTGSVRQRFEQHRTMPACAGCHMVMDPLGFAFEGYDAIGAYRTKDDNGFPVDASGKLGDQAFASAPELAADIAKDPAFPRCLAERLFVYALGRAETSADQCAIDAAWATAAKQGGTLPALLTSLAQSLPFTQRRGESP
jgi:hypothetical protein